MTATGTRTVGVVRAWARLYTSGLPADERERRLLELESDLWEHLHDPDEGRAPRAVLGRCVRGVPADVRWRYRTLLDARGARQRRDHMSMSVPSRWWTALAAALGALLLAVAALGTIVGADESSVALAGAVGAAVSGVLVVAGLVRMRSSPIGGSRLVVAGAALTLLGGIELVPIGVAVVVSGLWSGDLRLSDAPDAPDLAPVTRQQVELTRFWWAWLAVAVVLFAVGWLPLIFDDPDDLTFGGWYTWILSWLGAIVTGGVGVVLGGLRLVVRHRTRLT